MKAFILLSTLLTGLLSAEPPSRILAPVESVSKVIHGLEFSAVTQSEWQNPAYLIHDPYQSIVIQLRVTNRGDKAVLFPTFESFHAYLKTPEGKVMSLAGTNDATCVSPNILLQPGQSFSLQLDAMIEYKRAGKDKDVKFILKNGTGSTAEAKLGAGDYSIFFDVNPTPYDFEKGKLPAPLWSGKGITESVGFKFLQ